MPKVPCFACGRITGYHPALADTRDSQVVFVGASCFKKIKASGEEGWQPPRGGPRLWTIARGLSQQVLDDLVQGRLGGTFRSTKDLL